MAMVVIVQLLLLTALSMVLSYGDAHAIKQVQDQRFGDENELFQQDGIYLNELQVDAINKMKCPSGYRVDVRTLSCKPVCVHGCGDGFCALPDQCACDEGYEFVLNKCIPICSNGCRNGYCVAAETCQCFFGWDWNTLSRTCERSLRYRLRKRSMYGSEYLYVQPWGKSTKPPAKKVTRQAKTTKKILTLTIE